MSTANFEYWRPGSEERQLRVFVSHRHKGDRALYDEVFNILLQQGFAVQDLSLPEERQIKGPRGGRRSELDLQAEIAARIYTSDIVIAPSRVGASHSHWVLWEVRIAAAAYSLPVLFVNHQGNQQRRTRLVAELEDLGLPHDVADPNAPAIVSKLTRLTDARPTWSVRQAEPDTTIRFRGPPEKARERVFRMFPYQSRFADIAVQPDARKHSWWRKLRGFDRGLDRSC